MELISRDETKRKIIEELDSIDHVPHWVFRRLERVINSLPTIEERKEGEWVEEYDEEASMFLKRRWRCSACNDWQTYGRPKYCPHCGARMKGETNDSNT